jgi:hypothetical protein
MAFGDTPERARACSELSRPPYWVHIYMIMIDKTRVLHIDNGVMIKLVGSISLWQWFFLSVSLDDPQSEKVKQFVDCIYIYNE